MSPSVTIFFLLLLLIFGIKKKTETPDDTRTRRTERTKKMEKEKAAICFLILFFFSRTKKKLTKIKKQTAAFGGKLKGKWRVLRGKAEAFGSVFSGTVFILSPAFFEFLKEKDGLRLCTRLF